MTAFQEKKLLLSRAGFGLSLNDLAIDKAAKALVPALLKKANVPQLSVVNETEWVQMVRDNKQSGRKGFSREVRKSFRETTMDLNLQWLNEMVRTEFVLVEKMSLFWHGHFATRVVLPYFNQQLVNSIRNNALGNFRTLLFEASKSPAMLQFLNNQQNRRQHPNENFAREVMELFTLGRGNYTEQDIKEAARAFTGWGYTTEGGFVFREKFHDAGEKTFLGKKGNFQGDDILNILLENKQTAKYITRKIYRYFVNESSENDQIIEQLSNYFFESDYNISGLLSKIFTSDWFYDESNIGSIIKSPVDLLVGYHRTIPAKLDKDRSLIVLQRALGQLLFYPPTVAGWPGGKNWIDSSTLVIRMRLPEAFYLSQEIDITAKEIDAEMNEVNKKPLLQDSNDEKFRIGTVEADWSGFINYWKKESRDSLPKLLADFLLVPELSAQKLKEVRGFADSDSVDDYIKSLTILLMKLPEYQLS